MSESPADAQSADHAEREVATVDSGTMRIVSGLAAIIGAMILVSPFVLDSTDMAMWNNLIVGGAILVLAGFNFYRLTTDRLANVGVASLVALLGLWAVVAPFVLDMGSDELLWGTAIAGLLVAALSGYSAYANRRADRTVAGTRV